jgi:hypothetical protein
MSALAAATESENKTDYFISHVQAESKDVALEFFYSMKERGKKCWLDVKMKERDEAAMKEGIKLCEIVLVIMSPTYFTRPFCVKELEWAVEFEKPIVVVIDVALKSEIGNILGRCPADKSYLRGIGGINFNEVFRGNPVFWEASMKQVVEAQPKILKRDGTVIKPSQLEAMKKLKLEQERRYLEQLEMEEERLLEERVLKKYWKKCGDY